MYVCLVQNKEKENVQQKRKRNKFKALKETVLYS